MSLDDFFDEALATPPPAPPKPKPEDRAVDPVGDLVSEYMGMQQTAAKGAMLGALDADPEAAGRAATISAKTGSPFAVVEENLSDFDAQLQLERNALIVSNNSAIAGWLADDMKNARIAKDDFDNLDMVSKGLSAIGTGWTGSFDYNERLREQARKEFGLATPGWASALDQRIKDNPKMGGVYGALQAISGFTGGLLDSMFRAWDETATGAAAGAILGGGLTAEAGGVGAAPGALAGAGVGFSVGFNMDQSLIAAGEFYLNTENVVNEDGQPLDPAARHGAAALVFLGAYALNQVGLSSVNKSASAAMSELVAAAIAKKTFAKAVRDFGTGMARAGLEGAAIFGAMAGTQIFAEEAAKQLSPGDFAGLFNSEAERDVAMQRLLTAAALGAAFMPFVKLPFEGRTLVLDTMRARQAQNDIALLERLETGAAESKTRTRNLDAFMRFVSSQTDGTPIENVSIPGARVMELYQSLKLEPGADDPLFGKFVPDIKEQLDQAAETGGDIVMPLSGYITHLAGSDVAKAIRNDLRLRPDGMTFIEAETYAKERGRLLEENAVDYQFTLDQVFSQEDPVQRVYEDAFTKLRQAGHTIDASKQYAGLLAARYRTRSERVGGTKGDAFDMYAAEGLEIKRELPKLLKRVKVDYRDMVIEALRRGDRMPTDRQLFGPTVLEFIRKRGGIVDQGGELRAMDFGKKGMPTGIVRPKSKGGKITHGLDETALALWEAGYFPEFQERPSPQDLIDAMADELAGNRRYQFGTDREAETMFREAVSELEEFLSRNEMDVAKLSNAQIKRALTQFEKEQKSETQFSQSPAPKSAAFKKWFKKSKVVDGKGKPLRLYHGTTADFASFSRLTANREADWGAGFYFSNNISDVGVNYAGRGPDLTNKIQLAAERIASETDRSYDDPAVIAEAEARFVQHEGATIPVFLSLQNPVEIGGKKETFFDFEQAYDEAADDYGEETGLMADFIIKVRSLAEASEFRVSETELAQFVNSVFEEYPDGAGAHDLLSLARDKLTYIEDDNGNMAVSEFLRQVLEEMGFDGVIDRTVNDKFGTGKKIGKPMEGMGEETVHYIAFHPEQVKSAIGNRGTYDSADANILHQPERGKIAMREGQAVITLFRDADLSTFLHETGHLWFEELKRDYFDVAPKGAGEAVEVGASVKADFESVLKWMGAETPADVTIDMHEKFARAFEAYLLEGKAPSTALGRIFKSFKQWLVRIYRDISSLQTPINDELRGVFDRMIATDEEIAAAVEREAANPVFATPEDAGMTRAEFAAYTRKIAKAQDDADKKLLEKTMATVRERRTKEWQAELKAVREDVAAPIRSRPDLRAEYWLRTGRSLNGLELPKEIEHARISRSALEAMYGSDQTYRMLPLGVTAKEGGLHPDDAATLFGYANGDDLVKALMTLEANRAGDAAAIGKPLHGMRYVNHLIDRDANDVMLERHGDALNDGSIEEEAISAVHNKAQAEVMAIELKALARKVGRPPLSLADLRGWVDEQISEMPVTRATNNSAFLRQEGAFGRDVQRALLKGDVRNAFILKQRQLVNHLMVVASREAKDDFDAATKMFSRYAGRQQFKALDPAYVDQIHAILKRMGYPTKRQDAELASGIGGVSLREFVDGKLADGFELVVPDFMLDPLWGKRPRDMTMGELRGVQDAMTTMIHSARLEKSVELEGKRAEFEAVKSEAVGQLDQLPVLPDDAVTKEGAAIRNPSVSAGKMDALRAKAFNFKTALRQTGSALRKVEELVDILDAAAAKSKTGIFNRVIFRPIADAQVRADDLRATVTAKWLKLRDEMPKAWKASLDGKRVTVPELKRRDGKPWSMTKSELLMVALNTGNKSNFDKMLKGEFWDADSVKAALDRYLTEDDWKFVQSTWDIIGSLWPEIEAMQRRLTGLGPDKIEAVPVETKFGPLPGGYFPVMYDAALSPDVDARARANASKLFDADYQGVSTPKGHTKRRVEDYARPLAYDFGRIAAHLESVIHDLSYREAVMQAHRFVADKEMRSGIVSIIGKENYDQFLPWLKHIANEKAIDQRGLHFWDGMAKGARINGTLVGLGFRASTMLMQIAGYSDSAEMIGAKGVASGFKKSFGFTSPLEAISATLRGVSATKVGKAIGAKHLASGFDAISGSPRKYEAARAFVLERSGEMRHRFENIDRDMSQGLRELMGKRGVLNDARRFAYYGIAMMDQAVVVPSWIGAFQKGLAEGKSEADAIFYADKVVRLSQGAGAAKDLAAVQRSHNEWFKLTTMFYSYFNHVVNRQFAIARQAKGGVAAMKAGDFKKARGDFAMVLARSWWLLVVPPLLSNLLVGRGPEEDEDVASWAMRKVFFNLWGGVPIVRDVANMLEQKSAGRFSDFKLTPAERMVDAFARTGDDAYDATFGDDPVSDKWVKHAIETSGYVFGLPGAGQAGTSVQYLWDTAEGRERPENASEFVGSVLFGPKRK